MIESNPSVLQGKPVVAGTRLSALLILEHLAAGESVEQVFEAYPRLTREGVSAALEYAVIGLKSVLIRPPL